VSHCSHGGRPPVAGRARPSAPCRSSGPLRGGRPGRWQARDSSAGRREPASPAARPEPEGSGQPALAGWIDGPGRLRVTCVGTVTVGRIIESDDDSSSHVATLSLIAACKFTVPPQSAGPGRARWPSGGRRPLAASLHGLLVSAPSVPVPPTLAVPGHFPPCRAVGIIERLVAPWPASAMARSIGPGRGGAPRANFPRIEPAQ
jgi:hypothetical protein